MQLYPQAERVLRDLEAAGYSGDTLVPVDVLNRFDQLHYHGTDALDEAIATCGIAAGHAVLEVGSGWGGCARYIAQTARARLSAVELQTDYHDVALALTLRAGLDDAVHHINADFLTADLPDAGYDHAVSWLALFHIPDRPAYLSKLYGLLRPNGHLFAEDLYQIASPPPDTAQDFVDHLYPNSLVSLDDYETGLEEAGFADIAFTDMTADWSAFTATRLNAFRAARPAYEAVHGAQTYTQIETFYEKMAGYFSDGLVGGLRVHARKL